MLGLVTVFMTLLGWSSVPLFITHFAGAVDVWTQNGWRYGFSALLWAPVVLIGIFHKTLPRGIWKAAVVPSIFNAVGQTAFALSFYHLDPATATFGLRMQIVFVAVGAYLLFPSERALLRSPLSWLAIVLVLGGIAGTLWLSSPDNAPKQVIGTNAHRGLGVVLAISGGMLFAAYGLSVRKFMHAFRPVVAFAVISQYTALALVIVMLVLAREPLSHVPDFGRSALNLSGSQFSLLLLSAIIGIALGHVFYYISIARLGVAVSSGVIQLQPFCVAIGQLVFFNKRLTGGQWVSGGLAVVGAVLLLWMQWRLSRNAAALGSSATLPEIDQPD